METVTDFIFLYSRITADGDCSHELKDTAPWKKRYDKPRQFIKKQRHHFTNKCPSSQMYGFSNSHVQIWELDHKEGWAPMNQCFLIVVLLGIPWKARRSNQSILRKINPEYLLEGLMLKLKPILWLPDGKSQLIGKDPDSGKDWGQAEKGMTEGVVAWWHRQPKGYEFEQTLGDRKGQGSLACCSPWGGKLLDPT